jgi:hypothetical protein
VLVEKIFIASELFLGFHFMDQTETGYLVFHGNDSAVAPSSLYSFLGLMEIEYSSYRITLKQIVDYSYTDKATQLQSTKLMYKSSGTVTLFQAGFLVFNPGFQGCTSAHEFIPYKHPFTSFPLPCKPCDQACLTCTSSDSDPTSTNSSYCLSCRKDRSLQQLPNSDYGKCACLEGTENQSPTKCYQAQSCKFNCLSFTATFMHSATSASFFLLFSEADTTLSTPLEDSLVVTVDGAETSFTVTETSPGGYSLVLPS